MTPEIGNDIAVAEWVSARIGDVIEPPFTAIGFVSFGRRVAGSVFNDYKPYGNIELTFAADVPFTRGMLRVIANYTFVRLQCSRLTVRTKQTNTGLCDILRRLGFVRETTMKDYFGPGINAELFRLLRREAKGWL